MPLVSEIWPILPLSLGVAGAAASVSSLVGIPAGLLIGLTEFRGKSLVKAVVFTGMATPPVVVGLVFYLALSRSGALGSLAGTTQHDV